MANCPNCGTPAQGRFCAKCGMKLEDTAESPPPQGPPPPPSGASQGAVPTELPTNVACLLCYIIPGITGILFLVLEPYNRSRDVRFHAFQSIFYAVATVVVWVVLATFGAILAQIPYVGPPVAFLVLSVFGLGVFLLWLLLMYKAYNNERFVLPVIGPLAEKQS